LKLLGKTVGLHSSEVGSRNLDKETPIPGEEKKYTLETKEVGSRKISEEIRKRFSKIIDRKNPFLLKSGKNQKTKAHQQ